MKLSILDRLVLLNVLPKEGQVTTLKIVRKLREDLSFSEEEHKLLNFRQEDERLVWDDEGDIDKEIEIGERATDIIKSALRTLNDQGKLHIDAVDIYDRFMENKES